MKILKYLLVIFFPAILYGQNSITIKKDLNNDGYIDTLVSYYDGGSGFGGTFITLINGNTKEKFEINDFGCFCDIKKTILIPPELNKKSNKPFLGVIKNDLLPIKMNVPDASLQWLITANINHKELLDNIYYDHIFSSPTIWIPGIIQLPKTYYIDIKGETLNKLYSSDSEIPEWYDSTKNEGWLVYYGHNHFRSETKDSLALVDSSPTYQVYKSSHGIVLKKNNNYAWIFISDYRLTGSPVKLRWESIGKVEIIDNFVIIQLINSIDFLNPIFITDIERGITVRLKIGEYNNKSYKIDNTKIIIENDVGTRSYELEKLFEELKKLHLIASKTNSVW